MIAFSHHRGQDGSSRNSRRRLRSWSVIGRWLKRMATILPSARAWRNFYWRLGAVYSFFSAASRASMCSRVWAAEIWQRR